MAILVGLSSRVTTTMTTTAATIAASVPARIATRRRELFTVTSVDADCDRPIVATKAESPVKFRISASSAR
jgi:hypothetical protein